MTIYERIKFLREKLNMSQQELALKVGYQDKSAVSKVERGERDITQTMVAKYATALHTTPAYLMGWEEEKPPVNDLSEDERRLIEIYRKISPEAGEMLLTMVNIFEEIPQDRAQMLLAMIRAGIENQG
jgi:transcriptional regulator with XRE-family HTH domain